MTGTGLAAVHVALERIRRRLDPTNVPVEAEDESDRIRLAALARARADRRHQQTLTEGASTKGPSK